MRLGKPVNVIDPDALLQRPGARLLVLAPHPDDESLAAGGLLQRALGHGVPMRVVFGTDGEANPWPQRALERRLWIGPRQREAWAVRRRREADAALRVLGVSADRVIRLGWPDGGVTRKLVDDTAASLARVRALIDAERPTLLALPDLVDRHPDHSALHVLMEMALQDRPRHARPECLHYLLHGRARPGAAQRAVLALSTEEARRKRAAIAQHASQMILSRRRMLRFATASEAFNTDRDCSPTGLRLPWTPSRLLRPRLALLVVDAAGGFRLRPGGGRDANLRWGDGSPAARTLRPLKPPFYVKLVATLPSAWIFDSWGWCRLGAADA